MDGSGGKSLLSGSDPGDVPIKPLGIFSEAGLMNDFAGGRIWWLL